MAEAEMQTSKAKVSAVVVVYNNYQSLSVLIKSLCGHVDVTVVVDNSSVGHTAPEYILNDTGIVYHRVGSNKGLGAGLNIGIHLTEKTQSDWVLLLDQDSVVSENMVDSMLNE